ncbi:MAG: tetratricopeptide repeat protein [Proteobacteria bacterium]|nr:tetratricopeptide repeat protein [Pseudomonadota bacterium]
MNQEFRFSHIGRESLSLETKQSSLLEEKSEPKKNLNVKKILESPHDFLDEAYRHIQENQPDKALEITKQGIDIAKADERNIGDLPDLWFARAVAEQNLDLDKDATTSLLENLKTTSYIYRTLEDPLQVGDHIRLGMSYVVIGDIVSAIKEHNFALKIIKDNKDSIASQAEILCSLGILHFLQKDYENAIGCCERSHDLYNGKENPSKEIIMQVVLAGNLMNLKMDRYIDKSTQQIFFLQREIESLLSNFLKQTNNSTEHPIYKVEQQILDESHSLMQKLGYEATHRRFSF